jgi:hypothetical protein
VSPAKFVLSGRRLHERCVRAEQAKRKGARCTRPIALRVTFVLNETVRVSFLVRPVVTGRGCVRETSANLRSRHCPLLIAIGKIWTRNGRSGTNAFSWSGKVGSRSVGPGRYRLSAWPSANRTALPSHSVSFELGR